MPRRFAGDFPKTATNFFEQGLNSLTMWGCPPGFVQVQDSCIPAEETGENQVAIVKAEITGDEWWLKPDQQPNETREEWKARTFAMRFGQRTTLGELLKQPAPAETTGDQQVTTSEEVTEISRLDQLFIKAVNENTEEAWDAYRKEHQKFRQNILTKFWKTKIKSQRVAKMGAQELLSNDPTREPLDVLNEWRRALLHLEELVEDIPRKLVEISGLIEQREKDGQSSGK